MSRFLAKDRTVGLLKKYSLAAPMNIENREEYTNIDMLLHIVEVVVDF